MRTTWRGKLTSLAAGVACVAVVASGFAAPAQAEPTTAAQAQAELERLHEQLGGLEESYAQAQISLQEGQRKLDALNGDITAQQQKVDALAEQARQVTLTQFRGRGVDQTTAIFVSGDPETFMRTLSTTQQVTANMNTVVQNFQAEQANLADLQRSAAAEVTTLQAKETESADLLAQGRAAEDEMSRTLDRLTAQERAALEAAQAEADRQAQVVTDAATAAATTNAATTTARAATPSAAAPAASAPAASTPAASAPASGSADPRALQAVQYAISKVGKSQYVWGAEGPNAFDCSGLMLAAYKSAGVSLPHSSITQSQLGKPVSRDQLRPGDLIFWYSPVSHVGMYVGNGNIVHARNTRVDIVMQSLASYPAPYSGARRVVG